MHPDIVTWIAIGVLTVIALFFALAFLSAYFEKRSVLGLVPAGAGAPSERSGAAAAFIAQAENQDFKHIGYFIEPSGWKRDYVSLLLSSDELVLAIIVHGIGARFSLSSMLSNGPWLITMRSPGEADLSGLSIEAYRPGMFSELLAFHHRRLAETQTAAITFDPQRVVLDMVEHQRARAQRLVADGLARWRNDEQSAWSYRLGGSLRISMRMFKDVRSATKAERKFRNEEREQLPTL